ncbi:MAG: lamin tail domain-containing protein, partial [Oscillospiraceae bacterium]|nr:lamin tail domain-containing protein [Oscillospiraceae bacterium]
MTQKRNKRHTAIKRLAAALLISLAALLIAGCGKSDAAPAQAVTAPADAQSEYAGSIKITELLAKNRSVLMDETGAFPDWVELENVSAGELDLSGFTIADGEDEDGWRFPAIKLKAGERLLIYADGTKNAAVTGGAQGGAKAVHVDFSLSEGESVCLFDAGGALVDKAACQSAEADAVLCLNERGEWGETLYPTPGYENSAAGYDAWQSSLIPDSPLMISEVVTANFSALEQSALGYCDYAEIKNVSAAPVELSEYCLSDDDDELSMWQFPSAELAPGESVIVLCEKGEGEPDEGFFKAGFELNSESEQLYLSRGGRVVDYAFLRGIPYGGSFGRMDGENGWFYFAAPQPYSAKRGGCRRVSAAPETTSADGIFDGVTSMEISLAAPGQIYYTIDGSLPSAESEAYKSPISIDSTCVIRAVAIEDGALPSSALTLSYILNEGHSLPVVSLVSDDP